VSRSGLLNLKLGEDIGTVQELETAKEEETLELITKARDYLMKTVYTDARYKSVKKVCRNQDPLCAYWAVMGECQANPGYMNVTCAPVCQTCEFIDLSRRCPVNENATNVWHPGDLNKMFERIITQPEYQKYEPVVLSRPDLLPVDSHENSTQQPWVIFLDNFLSPEEANRFIEIGAKFGYERSSDVGELKFDGTYDDFVNEGRTSTNAWCNETCAADPLIKPVLERMESLTQIPDNFTEHLQLLKYEVGQFYQTHRE
jgi:prolyl 4-hydroxylase